MDFFFFQFVSGLRKERFMIKSLVSEKMSSSESEPVSWLGM